MTSLEQIAALSQSQVDAANAQRDQQLLGEDFDAFLQLLTTQLQNQDPLEPLDTNQFTEQLVQFSSVEQQIQTNSYLESLITSTEAQAVNAVVGYLGSTITANGVVNALENGSAAWVLDSPQTAENSTIRVYDENGTEVFESTTSIPAGQSTFTWDGVMSNGQQAPDALYFIQVEGNNAAGDAVDVNTAITGKVTSVDLTGGEPVLRIGDVPVTLAALQEIEVGS